MGDGWLQSADTAVLRAFENSLMHERMNGADGEPGRKL
jgi:hypothetical protein